MAAITRRRRVLRPLAPLLVAAAATGCAPDEPESLSLYGDPAAATAEPLTDPGIETLVSLINGAEIMGARAVQPKLVSPAARAFAQMLIDDHTAVRQVLPDLEGDAPPPAQFATLRAITHAQSGMFATLPAGPGFDVFFVTTQEGTHAMVLDSLRHWHAVAEDEELRRSLAFAIDAVEKHLGRARALQRELSGPSAGPAPTDTVGPVMPTPGPPDTLPAQGTGHHGGGDTARSDTAASGSPGAG